MKVDDGYIAILRKGVKGRFQAVHFEHLRDFAWARERLDETERRIALGYGRERLENDYEWYAGELDELVAHFVPRLALPKDTPGRWRRQFQAYAVVAQAEIEFDDLRDLGAPLRKQLDARARMLIAAAEFNAVRKAVGTAFRKSDHERKRIGELFEAARQSARWQLDGQSP